MARGTPSNYPNGFANGVVIRGIPLTVAHPGEVFWVNNSGVLAKNGVGGSGNNDGTYQRPFSTIAQAFDAVTASRGDIIAVMPGHAETVSAAAGLEFDVAGVAVIGLGGGALKPTITLDTSTASDINISASNVTVYNFRFVSGIANLVHCLDVTGANVTVDNCEFMASAAATAILTSAITTTAAFGFTFTNNTVNMESSIAGLAVTDVATSGVETLADNSVISNNKFLGNFSTSAIFNQTSAAEGLVISDNDIFNVSTSAAAGGISLSSSCTGMIYGNRICVLETSAIAGLIVNQSCAMIENYAVNVISETGGLVGVAST